MDLRPLRAKINTAKKQETETRELRSFLEQRSFDLHRAIRIPDDKTSSYLFAFVMRYIEQVPDLLTSTLAISKEIGIEMFTLPTLELAVSFLMCPVDEKSTRKGLLALMNNCYVAYRLVEEISDRFTSHCNEPLLPIDISKFNIITHHLIGDELATDLDIAIHIIAEQQEDEINHMAIQLPAFDHRQHRILLENAKSWPPFNKNMPIDITFSHSEQTGTTH